MTLSAEEAKKQLIEYLSRDDVEIRGISKNNDIVQEDKGYLMPELSLTGFSEITVSIREKTNW